MSEEIESGNPPQQVQQTPQPSSTPTPPSPSPGPVPYERFKSVRDDYRSAQAELADARLRLQSFDGWMSPKDHDAAVEAAVLKSRRSGDLAVHLVGAGVERDSREFRFLASEFDEIEPDAWDEKLNELREQSPAFFSSSATQTAKPRTNPEAGTRAPATPSGGVVTAEKIRSMTPAEYLANREEILRSMGTPTR